MNLKCPICKDSITPTNAEYWTADGSRRRKKPICKVCHESKVRGIGRGLAKFRSDTRNAEQKENIRETKLGVD